MRSLVIFNHICKIIELISRKDGDFLRQNIFLVLFNHNKYSERLSYINLSGQNGKRVSKQPNITTAINFQCTNHKIIAALWQSSNINFSRNTTTN